LAGNTGTNITVSINANATNLVQFGSYQDQIVFSNLTAKTQIPTVPEIVLQVGFGFFDDFGTYSNGDIDGQNNWYNPTAGDNDNPYVIADGVLVTPAGGSCAGNANDAEPAKNIASMAVTDSTQFAYLGMSMTVTSAPTTPNTWDFTLLPTVPGGNVTINEARTAVNDNGSGYVWNTHVNGFDSFYHGTTTRAYYTNYIVIIVGDIVNSNCWVFVNPPSSNTSDLFGMTYDAHDGPDVAGTTGWIGPGSVGVGSIDIDNYCANPQAGFLISKMALSTNYASVYNFLNPAPACSAPTASFTPASASGAAPLTVNFTDTSTPNSGTITTWVWAFGDGGTSGSQNPSHTYTLPGSYTASLSVTNSCGDGSASSATASITVYDPFAWWESSSVYNLTSALTNGNASYTGDGMSNTNKFLAGFSPTNAAAYLHVISISKVVAAGQTNVTVTYLGANGDSTYVPGVGSRTNILEYSDGTGNGSYTNNFLPTGQTNILGGGTGLGVVTNMTDSGEPGSTDRYYRVRVLLP
jgi:PKD repeat protein